MHIANNNILSGHPCLTPLSILIGLDLWPFIVNVEVALA